MVKKTQKHYTDFATDETPCDIVLSSRPLNLRLVRVILALPIPRNRIQAVLQSLCPGDVA